ncbi:hypothetical protein [Microvirus mar59]|uniref:Uncharacterized protein n=1 Tax=Microvirus mar59 TaxID=2851195 RepID=A0A8F5MLS1_9VIRU|nr:hypothetical protein [Microvirus mar59]
MKQYVFIEETNDRRFYNARHASDNQSIYYLQSAYANDLYCEFVAKHQHLPHSSWYRRHFSLHIVKIINI